MGQLYCILLPFYKLPFSVKCSVHFSYSAKSQAYILIDRPTEVRRPEDLNNVQNIKKYRKQVWYPSQIYPKPKDLKSKLETITTFNGQRSPLTERFKPKANSAIIISDNDRLQGIKKTACYDSIQSIKNSLCCLRCANLNHCIF